IQRVKKCPRPCKHRVHRLQGQLNTVEGRHWDQLFERIYDEAIRVRANVASLWTCHNSHCPSPELSCNSDELAALSHRLLRTLPILACKATDAAEAGDLHPRFKNATD